MGYRDVKNEAIAALQGKEGTRIEHEQRHDLNTKNLLATEEVSVDAVIKMLNWSSGKHYSCSAHHLLPEVDVHEFRNIQVRLEGEPEKTTWYVKLYIIEPTTWFISVHR